MYVRLRVSPRFEVHHRSSRRPQQLRLPLLSHLSSPSGQCDGLEQLWRPLTQHKSISCAATLVAAGFGNDLRQAPNPHRSPSDALSCDGTITSDPRAIGAGFVACPRHD